ncbi:E3 ubiquitin-protein ligase TRIM68-like [Dromiciops gliroides]|uniref:E3 ubiquitin-protein ligase TRIM68-like n=1 Tax=Dromiciops gliroides TaxID=33562 RepID=UPI001CC3F433|nr:E3 ubiquitin-protein ligase TRIM68-like [Dromiciops gliroides]
MATKEITESLQNMLTCHVCQAYLKDPVEADCGHSVCQSCLSPSRGVSTPTSCRTCKEISEPRSLIATLRRRGKLPFFSKRRPYTFKRYLQKPEGPPRKCDRHQEDKKLFCANDKTLLCESCSQSPEHKTHNILTIKEAAKGCRGKLRENLKRVYENLKDVHKLIIDEKKIPRTWAVVLTEQVEMTRKSFEQNFQEISEFLSEQEEEVHSLVELNEEENEMFEQLKENEEQQVIQNREKKRMSKLQLLEYKNDLREMGIALEEKAVMADTDLLQDSEDILSKSQSLLFQMPEPFTPKLSDSYCMHLRQFLRKFQESRLLQCNYPYELPDDDRKRTFTFADLSSGQMYAIYTSGSLHYMNGRDISITQLSLSMDDISEEEDYPLFTCYCLPIERERASSDFSPNPSIEWH